MCVLCVITLFGFRNKSLRISHGFLRDSPGVQEVFHRILMDFHWFHTLCKGCPLEFHWFLWIYIHLPGSTPQDSYEFRLLALHVARGAPADSNGFYWFPYISQGAPLRMQSTPWTYQEWILIHFMVLHEVPLRTLRLQMPVVRSCRNLRTHGNFLNN